MKYVFLSNFEEGFDGVEASILRNEFGQERMGFV